MKKKVIIAALQFVMLPLIAQQPMWIDPKVNSDNRMPRAADYFSYESLDKADNGK